MWPQGAQRDEIAGNNHYKQKPQSGFQVGAVPPMPLQNSKPLRGIALIAIILVTAAGYYLLTPRETRPPPEIKPPSTERKQLYSLHGVVFHDYDGDGMKDLVEPVIHGARVTVNDFTSSSNQSGIYEIRELPAGRYKMHIEGNSFRHICLSNETILSINTAIGIEIANDTRRDLGLSEGFLTLPVKFGSSHPLFGYHDLDKTRGKVRSWKGEMGAVEAKPSDQPGVYHSEVMVQDDHEGIDFTCNEGTPVVAASPGRVSYARVNPDGGLNVVIDHGNRFKTSYGHVSKFLVSEGETVSRGQVIALSGNTGRSGQPHLHFGFYWLDKPQPSKPGPFSDPYSIDPFRDLTDTGSMNYWTKDNDPQFPHSDMIGNHRLCREDGIVTNLESLFLNDPKKYGKELLNQYLSQLESNSSYAAVAREMMRLPELSFSVYGLSPTTIEMVEAVEDIAYLALLAGNPETKGAFELMIKGGTPDQGDFSYSVPNCNTELQVLYWLACRDEFKKDDTLAQAIAIVNGFWATVGDENVRDAAKKDTEELLKFLRSTNDLQMKNGHHCLEDYPLEAKICLGWTGSITPNLSNLPLVWGAGRNYGARSLGYHANRTKVNIEGYNWNTVSLTTLKSMQTMMISEGWIKRDIRGTIAFLEEYFYFSSRHLPGHWEKEPAFIAVDGRVSYDYTIGNVDWQFDFYRRTGKFQGQCTDESQWIDAWARSCGIATNTIWRGGFDSKGYAPPHLNYVQHFHPIFYDPSSKSWKASGIQLGVGAKEAGTEPLFLLMFRPPTDQRRYFAGVGRTPFHPDLNWLYGNSPNIFYWHPKMINLNEIEAMFTSGLATFEMKRWLLYS